MRILLCVLCVSSVCLSLKAQQGENIKQQASLYFEQEQYNLAIQYYLKYTELTDQNAEVNYLLAESYRKTFSYQNAEKLYSKVHDQAASSFPLTMYFNGLMLKLNGRFDQSITSFNTFISEVQGIEEFNDYVEQASIDIAGCEMAKAELLKNRDVYEVKSETVNTSFNDYAPALLDSATLIITSGRVESKSVMIDERYGEAFTDNFYFVKNGDAWQNKTKEIFAVTNTRYNDGSGNFNGQGNKYYFTACGKGVSRCRIFLSEYKNNHWTEPEPLNDNINYTNSEIKHPAVSQGGDTLLFASDRPGGFGKFDIWMSINSGNENWGPAMNCGRSINTKLNELAPAFTNLSNVFFMASDGHQSYGGLDLYLVKLMPDGTGGLYNLDYPFNSSRDDCFIGFLETSIYFSSNREGGIGGFDIYSAEIPSITSFIAKVSSKESDARMDVSNQALINGSPISSVAISAPLTKVLTPNAEQAFSITGKINMPVRDSLQSSYKIILLDESGQVLKTTTTNQLGKFRFSNITAHGFVYLGFEDLPEKKVSHAKIKDLLIIASENQSAFNFENIYFDFDQYDLRKESRLVLNDLAKYLKRFPSVQAEIFAYADDQGTEGYNLALSQQRGQAVLDYLAQQGVDQTSLAVVAKGKQGISYSDIEKVRQFNRRVECHLYVSN